MMPQIVPGWLRKSAVFLFMLLLVVCNSRRDEDSKPAHSSADVPAVAPQVAPKVDPLPAAPAVHYVEPKKDTVQDKCDLYLLQSRGMVSEDSIHTIFPSIGNCKDCRELDLSNAGITEIPPEIGAMTQLQTINLSNNNLRTIPPEIMQLPSIRKLDVSGNELVPEYLPENMAQWLDKIADDWRCTQKHVAFEGTHGFCNYAVGMGKHKTEKQLVLSGPGSDTIPVIMKMDSSSLRFYKNEGPPSGRYFALRWIDSTLLLDTVLVTAREDSVQFDCPPKEMARILSFNWKPGTLLLMRGMAELEVGPVKTWYLNEQWARNNISDEFDYSGKHYEEFKIALPEADRITVDVNQQPGCYYHIQWRIRFGNEPWLTLPAVVNLFEGPPMPTGKEFLLWVGDLDGDNAPDLLVAPIHEDYSGVFLQLFLSGRNKNSQYWKPAATYHYLAPGTSESSGC